MAGTAAAGLSACSNDNDEGSGLAAPDALMEGLSAAVGDTAAARVSGAPPSYSSDDQAPVIQTKLLAFEGSPGGSVEIPLDIVVSGEVQRFFARVPGANSYFAVSTGSRQSSQTEKAADSALIALHVIHFRIDLPASVETDPICLDFSVQQSQGDRVSRNERACIDVVEEGAPEADAAPVADAGQNQEVSSGDSVTLDGAASTDADGTIALYQWKQVRGPDVDLQNADTAAASFVAPQTEQATALIFSLSVTDDQGVAARDLVAVTIPSSAAFSVSAGHDQIAQSRDVVTLFGSVEPAGTESQVEWVQIDGPVVTLFNSTALSASFVAPDIRIGFRQLAFRLTVTDASGQTDSDDVSVRVESSENNPQ